ncbi:GNAT family N-acetyltransferase [Sanguibacter antarcticus]|uniref:Putative acetyltransferase n=1 Tax=Sanguibacter antarcticus TaxID=372484 RepID=A0A2A9E5L0_9MICO|nr:GNAT family N-acetyltransferase [Sanguibacter antarcticus]PFG34248.1 putative acetyltransferase [Sanguibacter antarcticus]
MNHLDERYEIRHFAPALDGDGADAATAGWLASVQLAFHEKRFATPARESAATRRIIDDRRELTGVYERAAADRPVQDVALGADHPVGTFTSFTKTLDVGGGVLLDAHLISDVTVRPSHRRRGILRAMMVDNLGRAAEAGLAIAALTASEATIYRRFGFGAATHVRSVRVQSDHPAHLLSVPAGNVELADPSRLGESARRVFETFHASTPGSIDRHAREWGRLLTGKSDETEPQPDARSEAEPDPGLRAAIHTSPGGEVDGYVTYVVEERGDVSSLTVVDLVAVTPDAYLGLWELLLSIDLVTEVVWRTAPLDDPLHHALADSRRRRVTEENDLVWLRILDPVVALEARPYSVEDTLTLEVTDSLHLADGVLRVETRAGSATVTRQPEGTPADLEMDVAVLGSLYLGGTDPVTLGAAGLVHERTDRALLRLRALFAQDRQVYGITRF